MLPRLCFSFDRLLLREKRKEHSMNIPGELKGLDPRLHTIACNRTLAAENQTRLHLRSGRRDRNEGIKERKKEMANRVAISDLIQRVASTCLTRPLAGGHGLENGVDEEIQEVECEAEGGERLGIWQEEKGGAVMEKVRQMEEMMMEVFDAASAMKRAYVGLQEAHNPWDPDKIRIADAAVVAELRKLGRLRDRYRRGGVGAIVKAAAPLREAVAPYEAALDELKRELKAKEAEVESLKEKLRNSTPGSTRKKGRLLSSKRVGCSTGLTAPVAPTTELFEACMEQVKSASKSFTAHLLSLMRAARWDIAAAVRSIIDNSCRDGADDPAIPSVEPHHAKHAMESYVCRKIFHGFENETFYIEGSLASLLQPAEYRRDCFAQFRDMRGMDPAELLGILPTCQFGRFAGKKYMAIVHPRMEESLFGGVDQRRQVLAETHPRTEFYGEFLRLAKAVWLLHLLAFALDPAPSHFEARKGAEFHPDYMESVVRFAGGRVLPGSVVGFPVGPGFKLGNGAVVRARVYVAPRL